ncbi:hypothetical protein KUCAC02_015141 [Chaenocephalus aceratus]|uniref:Uncharacterized protein n=1 Tax=Chaenocephalus aceratus TaxID=36190 RepID=A0ACB9XYQ7_CHAAC|nr:hypothetical protein KUCAC02_015141 [Chaenocephalus aceratus]
MDSFCLGSTAVVGAFDVYREEGREGSSSSSSEVFFHVEAPSGFDNKKGSLSPAATRRGSSPVAPQRDRRGKGSLQRALLGLDQGDRESRL